MGATYADLKLINLFTQQGNEPLMGVLPLEAMDLLVDPLREQLICNPAHPNFPVALAK